MLSYLPRQHTYLAWVLKGNGCWLNPLFDQLYLLPRIFSALHPSKSLNSLAQLLTTYVFLLVPALACRLPLSPQTSAQPGKKRREYMEAEALWLETETPCYLVGKITVAGPGVFSRQWSVSAAWQTHIPPEILSFVFFFPPASQKQILHVICCAELKRSLLHADKWFPSWARTTCHVPCSLKLSACWWHPCTRPYSLGAAVKSAPIKRYH